VALSFIALLLALALSHAVSEPERLRNFSFFAGIVSWLQRRLPRAPTWLVLVLALLPLGLSLAALLHLLTFELLRFALATAVLWWSLGPRELTHDVDALIDARTDEQRAQAVERLAGTSAPSADWVALTATASVRRWFAPILWFVLLGPLAALLVRLLAHLSAHSTPDMQTLARRILTPIELPAAWLLVLALALASHLDAVFSAAKDAATRRGYFDPTFEFLSEAIHSVADSAEATSDGFTDEITAQNLPLARTINLLQRSLFVWMTVLGLIVLVRAA